MAAGRPDRIGVALGALGAGAATGAALVTLCLALFRQQLMTTLPLILFFGIVTAVATAWSLAGAIDDTWRRAVTATLAAFAGLMLAGLAAPADMIGGQIGLLVYAIVLAGCAGHAARVARRAGTS